MTRALVVAEHGARLRVHRGSLVVETRGARRVVPLADVDRVVIATGGVSVTSSALRVLASLGIDVLVLSSRGDPMVSLQPPFITVTVATRIAQYEASRDPGLRLSYAKAFAAAKIENQARHLEALALRLGEGWLRGEAARLRQALQRLAAAGDEREVLQAEAHAARLYWGALADVLPRGLGFQGRDQDAGDPVNASLNYLYGLLYSDAHRALAVHGLDPYLGFLHRDRSGAPALVFDYVEMFRVTAVDKPLVMRLLEGWVPEVDGETGYLTRETRLELIKLYMENARRSIHDGEGRRDTLRGHMARYARRLAQALRAKAPYRGFTEAPTP